jgi:hypothetical protein
MAMIEITTARGGNSVCCQMTCTLSVNTFAIEQHLLQFPRRNFQDIQHVYSTRGYCNAARLCAS